MNKTIAQIAEDCGISDHELLTRIVNNEIVFQPGDGNTPTICQMVAQLFDHIEKLEEWKASAISVTPPLQEIAQALGLPLGVSIHDKILPGIVGMKETIRVLELNLAEAGGPI